MNREIPTANRRNVIKTIGIGTLAGGAGLLAMSGGAAATANADYGEVTITSDDGTVEYVAIYGDSTVNWDGFDTAAQYFDITITAEATQDWDGQTAVSETELHTTGLVDLDSSNWGNDESLSGSGTSGTIETAIGLSEGSHDPTTDWHIVGTDPDGYGLPGTSLSASEFTVGDDGGTRSYTVTVHSTYTWYDTDENEVFSETFSSDVPVTVNNKPSTATGSSTTNGATGQ